MQPAKLSSLSVFFPCFNEEANVPYFIEEALEVLPTLAKRYEIIVVNDGSTDETGSIADEIAQNHKQIRVIHHEKNRGYGAALRTGIQKANYDWIFFTDGDLQFSLKQLQKFIPFTENYQAIIGYRKRRAEGSLRAFNAFLFKLYIDVLFRVHVRDIDCAFKLLKADIVKKLPLESNGAVISAEILYRLKKHGVKFKQLPVTHHLRKFGKPTGNHPKVVLKAGLEALRLYLRMKFPAFYS